MTIVSRGTVVYLLMAALFGAGIWLIFALGAFVQAPIDLAGEWELQTDDPAKPRILHIEQSGLFFSVRLDDQTPINLKLAEHQGAGDKGNGALSVIARSDEWTLTVEREAGDEIYSIALDGAQSHQWEATRRTETYAAIDLNDSSAAPESPPGPSAVAGSSALTTHAP